MKMLGRQKGLTFIGFIFAAAFVVFFGIVVMKVIPVYINHFSIIKSMKELDALPKTELQSTPEQGISYLKEYLSRKLYINEIRFISKSDMKIKRKRKVYEIKVPYTVEKQLFSNVFLVFKFEPSHEVSIEGD